jgi:hypothetical protein
VMLTLLLDWSHSTGMLCAVLQLAVTFDCSSTGSTVHCGSVPLVVQSSSAALRFGAATVHF